MFICFGVFVTFELLAILFFILQRRVEKYNIKLRNDLDFASFMCSIISAMFFVVFLYGGVTSYKDKKFIEKHFNKSYSIEELFWHSDEIKEMLIGKKINID
jgi:hypothetical protein